MDINFECSAMLLVFYRCACLRVVEVGRVGYGTVPIGVCSIGVMGLPVLGMGAGGVVQVGSRTDGETRKGWGSGCCRSSNGGRTF